MKSFLDFLSEDAEQLNELSAATLASYKAKAEKRLKDHEAILATIPKGTRTQNVQKTKNYFRHSIIRRKKGLKNLEKRSRPNYKPGKKRVSTKTYSPFRKVKHILKREFVPSKAHVQREVKKLTHTGLAGLGLHAAGLAVKGVGKLIRAGYRINKALK